MLLLLFKLKALMKSCGGAGRGGLLVYLKDGVRSSQEEVGGVGGWVGGIYLWGGGGGQGRLNYVPGGWCR